MSAQKSGSCSPSPRTPCPLLLRLLCPSHLFLYFRVKPALCTNHASYVCRSDGSRLVRIRKIKTLLARKYLIVYRCRRMFPLTFLTYYCILYAYKPGMHAGRTAEVRCPFETPRHLKTPAASSVPAEEFAASPTLRMVALVLSSFDEIEAPPDKSK